ncbi:DUF979 domain-containing protein [Pseudoduganella sp. GCM10020061]|uniref:DUF979 domain-containing protein n=1 Tax=Pseudoduganella sp. GCM10020061 TaxID=3317345 RepID=UPI0036413A7A
MIKLDYFYLVLGAMLLIVAAMTATDKSNPKRYTTALFWAMYAAIYLAGEAMPHVIAGAIMVAMALVAGFGGVSHGKPQVPPEQERRASAARLGNKLLIPALTIPVVTLIGSTLFKDVEFGGIPVLEQQHLTLVSLGCGALLAVIGACWLTRSTPLQGMRESRRMIDAISWAVVLPHLLAVLGLLFAQAGVGKAVAFLTTSYIPMESQLVAVAVYCIGMALFTVIMGNGFAAFPVMAAGVGIPVLIGVFGANPAVIAAIGMFSAYCGTLMTPMAANFNIIPAALLELPDKYGVIKAQIPTALGILAANIVLLYFLMHQ